MNAQPNTLDAGFLNGIPLRGQTPAVIPHDTDGAEPALIQNIRQQHQARLDTPPEIDPGDIERTAYEIYEENGCQDGCALEHWLEAERRLQANA